MDQSLIKDLRDLNIELQDIYEDMDEFVFIDE